MSGLPHQRCFNLLLREAVARCPECRQHYCRECVTEHEDRLVCASCLKKSTAAASAPRRAWRVFARLAWFRAGFLSVWLFFYFIGAMLVSLPTSFHELNVWKVNWWDQP